MTPFFPPAPSEAPYSMIDTADPEVWMAQTKINEQRILVDRNGQLNVWNRHGSLLTRSKGSDIVRAVFRDLPSDIIIDGGFVPPFDDNSPVVYVYDLPNIDAPYDQRRVEIARLVGSMSGEVPVLAPHCAERNFREFYESCKSIPLAEGIVWKKRDSYYQRQARPNVTIREWAKYRFKWEPRS